MNLGLVSGSPVLKDTSCEVAEDCTQEYTYCNMETNTCDFGKETLKKGKNFRLFDIFVQPVSSFL